MKLQERSDFGGLIFCGSDWRFGANRLVTFGPSCSFFALLFRKPRVDAWYVCFSIQRESPQYRQVTQIFQSGHFKDKYAAREMFLQKQSRATTAQILQVSSDNDRMTREKCMF